MAISKRKDAEVRREVRTALAKDPLITTRGLERALYNRGIRTSNDKPLSHEYICKLVRKVHAEALHELEDTEIRTRMARTKARFDVAFQKLSKVAYWEWDFLKEGVAMPTAMEQITALRTIMDMDLKLLSAEMDAGLYKRNLGSLELERRNAPLTPERRASIIAAMQAWGFIPK